MFPSVLGTERTGHTHDAEVGVQAKVTLVKSHMILLYVLVRVCTLG